jgi:aryl-alcohol dehydrogenase-like predicted oxidoreductase
MTMRPEPYEHLRTDAVFDQLESLERAAEERGVAIATLAVEFLFHDPRITAVIIGPRRPAHLTPIVDALTNS